MARDRMGLSLNRLHSPQLAARLDDEGVPVVLFVDRAKILPSQARASKRSEMERIPRRLFSERLLDAGKEDRLEPADPFGRGHTPVNDLAEARIGERARRVRDRRL